MYIIFSTIFIFKEWVKDVHIKQSKTVNAKMWFYHEVQSCAYFAATSTSSPELCEKKGWKRIFEIFQIQTRIVEMYSQ